MMKAIRAVADAVTCLALIYGAPAYAAEWVYVNKTSSGAFMYIDAKTIQREGDHVTVWERWDLSRDKATKERQRIVLNRYDCIARTSTVISLIVYYPDGTSQSTDRKPYEQEALRIVPGSMAEFTMEALCPVK